MMFLNPTTLFLCLLASAFGWPSFATRAAAADSVMEWQFYEGNDPDNKGAMTARLVYGVPETDNVQVMGVCDARPRTGVKFSSVTFGADIGALEDDKETELRVSGGGFDHALKGQIYRATGEEGLSGVIVDIEHNDPLWGAMDEKDSLDYLVPGYKAATLDLGRGRDKIKKFVQACRSYAAASGGQQAQDDPKEDGDGDEKEAFNDAKELGTVEAWDAFISNYPSGFRADLARAYVKKLGPSAPPVQTAPAKPTAKPKAVTKKVTGCEEGFKLVKGKCKRIAATEQPQGCPPGTVPVPETDNCVPINNAKQKSGGCDKGQIRVEGQCILKQDAASFCGPGYRLQGNKCVQGYAAPKKQKLLPSWQLEAIAKGCPAGMGWNAQEGCHEND